MISNCVVVSIVAGFFIEGIYANCDFSVLKPIPQDSKISGNKAFEVMISFDSFNVPSVEFFKSQVSKVFEKFDSVVDFNYVPCSLSHIVDTVLTCGDGTMECQIDVLQACVDNKYENESGKSGNFFVCMLTDSLQYTKGEKCAIDSGMDWNWLKGCKQTKDAAEYCNNRFELLNTLREQYVPGVMFNRKFNAELEKLALEDLEGTICKLLELSGQPFDGCGSN